MLRLATLSLLVLYPIAWCAPLMRAGLLPIFGLSEISVMTGLQSLWASDIPLALIVTVFALIAPVVKTIGLVLVQSNLLDTRTLPALHVLGKLAMADIFLIALYITLVKGIGYATIEIAWGLYLFTGCILASLVLSLLTERHFQPIPDVPAAPSPGPKKPDAT
ncbi:paraquat-inducible protein A [Phaeobacter sp. B1627]|uniref:paraquat-inducible protein A n=1 Tax=Phaeobacter sp. B1627 TaxID=2583809 RepID=UPI00111B9D6C|nr:paraquat-inducible protein A [Phaeobacter sp. B1627]TNJ42763.1 paraquat-inducible protein A [Phaeobacter sp. B1627]